MLESMKSFITTDNIALLSVIMTILIFVFSRRAELRYKKHDDRKVQYLKLISLMENVFVDFREDTDGDSLLTDELKKQFFDSGASLLLYGSKKLYRQYLFYREFASNPLVKRCKYYRENLIMYILADMLTTMRKEVGLSSFNNIHANEALGFFVNDISNNPLAKESAFDAKFRIRMIKFELGVIDRIRFLWLKKMFFHLIKPIWAAASIIIKYLFACSMGRLLIKIFPGLVAKVQDLSMDSE